MAKKNAGFFDLHIEKVVIGLCAVALGGAAYLSFGGGRFAVEGMGPAELCKSVGENADQLKQAVLNARPEAKSSSPVGGDAAAQLKKWFSETAEGLVKIARIEPVPPRTQAFPSPLPSNTDLSSDKRNLAQVMAPGIPLVMTGRTKFAMFQPGPAFGDTEPPADAVTAEKSVSWVAVGAQVDLVAQEAAFIAERYPDLSYPILVRVHLQRRLADSPSSPWVDVPTWLPFSTMNRPRIEVTPDGKLKMERTDKFRLLLEAFSEEIARPKLPRRVAGDKFDGLPLPYLNEPPKAGAASDAAKRAAKWIRDARSALEGKRPFDTKDVDAAWILASAAAGVQGLKDGDKAAVQKLLTEIKGRLPRERRKEIEGTPRSPERLMPLVAYDFSAEPGQTYVYRMRYEILNVFAGNRGELNNPKDAERLTVFSGWSPPSRPVQVQSDLYFYLTRADRAKREATVTVFRVTKAGDLIGRQDYKVSAGDKIGREEKKPQQKIDLRTGAICLEVDFDRQTDGKRDIALVYVDGADGLVRERLYLRDSRDPFLKALQDKKVSTKR